MAMATATSTARSVPASAAELGAAADARWEELDSACRIPSDLHEAALRAGLFRTLVPVELGGTGATPVEWFRTGVELARHDASFGWVVTQGAAEFGWIAAGGDPEWADEVLSDPLAASASTIAGLGNLAVEGERATLSGTWAFNTGAHGATWIGGLCLVAGTSGPDVFPELRFAWVPADRARIIDDWDPTGMRGTGSNSIEIVEQSILTAWTFAPSEKTRNDRGPYRCVVGNGNWPIAGSVAAVQLGAARRAIDEAFRLVIAKAPAPDFVPLAQNAATQRALIRAEGIWSGCVASVERELESMWDEANRMGELSGEQRVRLFTAHAAANQQAVTIINEMCAITGTAATNRAHPLSRCRRDSQALQGHIATNGSALEKAARIKLGLLDEDRFV